MVPYYKIINKKKRWVTILGDLLGSLLFFPRILMRGQKEIDPAKIQSILVIRTAYIGDVIMTIPILKPIRDRFPNAKISFLSSHSARGILEQNPHVDEVLGYDAFWFHDAPKNQLFPFLKSIRQRHFDLVIEARADIRDIAMLVLPIKARYKVSYGVGGGHYLLTHMVPYEKLSHKIHYHLDMVRHLGCNTPNEEDPTTAVTWNLNPSDTHRQAADNILKKHGITGDFVAIHPGSRMALKRWPNDRFALLSDWIMAKWQMPVVVVGSPEEKELVGDIAGRMQNKPVDLAGQFGLMELAAVLDRATMMICNDSAPMHVAAAMDTPIVAIFGPSSSIETGPFCSHHRVVEIDAHCRATCDEGTCLDSNVHHCIQELHVERLEEAVTDLMEEVKS
ncbi:MAG: glycosyltransferase family 9 protein [Magnetococcales bacterium]|nr:glycosyltransferase family 9 protein [Magnetococcales bacterium]